MPEKTNKNTQQGAEERFEVHAEDFIPYACHFDDHTILTKNGELMQVIKITGFTFESVHKNDHEILTLREAIRKAITESIKTNNFALWVHTIRRKSDLSTDGKYNKGSFSDKLNSIWIKRNNWEHKYVNELYVSILIEGQSLSILDFKAFFRSLYFPFEMRYRMKAINDASEKLHAVVNNMLEILQEYGAKRLKITKGDKSLGTDIFYSELHTFLGKIINLEEIQIPLAPIDIANTLSTQRVYFGFNVLELNGKTGKHFGTLLTIKEYHELSTKSIDEFLQLPQQFIITETFDFVNHKSALKDFEKRKFIFDISGDHHLAKASGLDEILDNNKDNSVDYGEHQITIMPLEDNINDLEDSALRIVRSLQKLGIAVIREDIFMEDCYWAQLPGNFGFIKRMSPLNSSNIAGYASLYNFPAGRLAGNHWGPAVTVLHTSQNTPYFFNFHYGNNGHTFIIGPYGAGKTVILNFLVSESCKFNPTLFYFDQNRGSEIFLRMLGGDYHRIVSSIEHTTIRFNPLQLPDSKNNRAFLHLWFGYLINSGKSSLDEVDEEKIEKAINYSYNLSKEDRILSNIIPEFWPLPEGLAELHKAAVNDEECDDIEDFSSIEQKEDDSENILDDELQAMLGANSFAEEEDKDEGSERNEEERQTTEGQLNTELGTTEERLSIWYGNGRYAHIFDNVKDEFSSSKSIYGFDMTQMVKNKRPLVPVIFYLLHVIEESLDGSPAMIILDEAWSLIDNPAFNTHIDEWLDRLRKKNAIAIFATESIKSAEKSAITKALAKNIETKIFLPNPNATVTGYADVFGLSNKEFGMLNTMCNDTREFLLIHNIDAVVVKLNLDKLDYELSIMTSSLESLAVLEGVMQEVGTDPKIWEPLFKKRLGV